MSWEGRRLWLDLVASAVLAATGRGRCLASATARGTSRSTSGRVVKRPRLKDTLAERILSEGEVHKLLVTAGQLPARQHTADREKRARRN